MKNIIKPIAIANFINSLNLKAQNTECGGYMPEISQINKATV